MKDLVEQYYKGITQQLRAEVDLVNSLFQHQGVKGNGNEAALRDFLAKFIPKKYAVGTGIVIDRNGKPSDQCDIVVYDDFSYPAFFTLTPSHFFPVDIVRVVIEVKTTMNRSKARIACSNIEAVRNLSIPSQYGDPPPLSKETANGNRVFQNWKYSPPAGCIFSYNTDVKDFQTFKRWFTPQNADLQAKNAPTLVGSLDQGIIILRDTFPRDNSTQPDSYTFPVKDKSGKNVLVSDKDARWQDYEGISYPVKTVNGNNILVDQSQILLLFVLYLFELIRIKEPNPRMELPIHYLSLLEDRAIKI